MVLPTVANSMVVEHPLRQHLTISFPFLYGTMSFLTSKSLLEGNLVVAAPESQSRLHVALQPVASD
jgi:hypothetical protein